ncbi:glutamate-5-semialdehyde dehydrogenase [Candidatus Bathyarchaeota archaeon]|nr:glutamate-5-semialdehyde dehydrogenase [Candidatus Bathyarchaeota archaeon]
MTTLTELGKRAKAASIELAKLPTEVKNRAIITMAKALEKKTKEILAANQKDVEAAQAKGIKATLLDRLVLDESRIGNMAQCLREVAALPDPVNQIVRTWLRPNGLIIGQLRVPIGVVGMIYESRPDVTSDASGICLKSGNAIILRGGSEAFNSNIILGDVLAEAAIETGVPSGAIQMIRTTDRGAVKEFMRLRGYVDVLIPRGGADLIKSVVEHSCVPVIETGIGNCHIYVDDDADLDDVIPLILNAKCQRPGTCNAVEKLLVHQKIADNFLPKIIKSLRDAKVEVRGDSQTRRIVPDIKTATDKDWYTEYLDLIIGIKVVKSLDDAINHINKYGSKHTDAILTRDFNKALRFIKEVDSASVNWNASTRFTDGNQYGLGAEIGISTQKIHARGPMSVEHLTTIKYFVLGRGHIRK